MEGHAPAVADVEHRYRPSGRRLPDLGGLRLVPRRDEQRAVGREEDAVEATLLPARLHAYLPALGAGRHLARDQVGLEVAGHYQAAVRAQADRVRERLKAG